MPTHHRSEEVLDKKHKGCIARLKKRLFYNSDPEIGSPNDFKHLVHVQFDHESGKYVGVPVEWEKYFQNTQAKK